MTIAAFISLIWCIGEDAPLSFLEALSLAGLMTILIHLLKRLIYGRKKIVDLGMQERVYFAGNLDELLAALYRAGLRLKERIGEYYIFTTNYRLLPSDEFVAKEERGVLCRKVRIFSQGVSNALLMRPVDGEVILN
jgi:hypothetical protein